MQMLVYENYSKFISATDTIREMRSDVAKMDDEMNALNVTMEGIERTLKRLEFLFDLPRKLEAAIAAEAFDDALKYHRINEDVLSSYSHIASLREIHAEARAILARLKRDLAPPPTRRWRRRRATSALCSTRL
ncbi:hypothetical protein M885DRAFT_291936 [Pelagophyceae sp. CCMP2097]|nr:hypothetical protein M885DRAFT_291936 [Pelagophyceae sp. CCMP2097]